LASTLFQELFRDAVGELLVQEVGDPGLEEISITDLDEDLVEAAAERVDPPRVVADVGRRLVDVAQLVGKEEDTLHASHVVEVADHRLDDRAREPVVQDGQAGAHGVCIAIWWEGKSVGLGRRRGAYR